MYFLVFLVNDQTLTLIYGDEQKRGTEMFQKVPNLLVHYTMQ